MWDETIKRKIVTWFRWYRFHSFFLPPSGLSLAHKITQHDDRCLSNVRRAARVAASNTSSTPSPVKDEHSKYFLAPTWAAVSLPSLDVRNFNDFFRISSIATGSSRKSFFRPTRIIGTPGQRSLASSIHFGSYISRSALDNSWYENCIQKEYSPYVAHSLGNLANPRRNQ
jgi:hypothetical protein